VRSLPRGDAFHAAAAGKARGKPFAILAVDYGEGAPRINDFLKKVPVRFTVLLDRDTSTATAWKVKVLPTTLVLDHSSESATPWWVIWSGILNPLKIRLKASSPG